MSRRGRSAWIHAWLMAVLLSGPAAAADSVAQRIESGGYHYFVGAAPAWVAPIAPIEARPPGLGAAARFHLVDDQALVGETSERYMRRIAGVYDKAGLEQISQIHAEFNPNYQTFTLHTLAILRGSERIDKLQPERITLVRREKELERLIYDGTVTAIVNLDDVRVGDRVEYAFTLRGSNPVLGPKFSAGFALSWGVPVDLISVRVRAPRSRPLRFKVHGGGSQPQVAESDGVRDYWLRIENQPAAVEESDVPGWYVPYPWVQFTEYADWGEVTAWAQTLYGVPPSLSPELAAAVGRIRASARTRREAVQQALELVQNEVRYLGIALGDSSHRPTAPDQVYKQRFGDCKDKTVLLMTLLAQFDVKAVPALVSTYQRRGVVDWLPTPHAFDHVIAAVDLDGQRFWLDGTRSHQAGRLERLGFPAFGKALLVVPGSREFVDLVPPAEYRADTRVTERFSIPDFRNPAALKVESVHHGERAEAVRWYLATNERGQVEREFLNDYVSRYPTLEPAGPLQVSDDTLENRVSVVESYRVRNLFKYQNGRLVAPVYGSVRAIRARTAHGEPHQSTSAALSRRAAKQYGVRAAGGYPDARRDAVDRAQRCCVVPRGRPFRGWALQHRLRPAHAEGRGAARDGGSARGQLAQDPRAARSRDLRAGVDAAAAGVAQFSRPSEGCLQRRRRAAWRLGRPAQDACDSGEPRYRIGQAGVDPDGCRTARTRHQQQPALPQSGGDPGPDSSHQPRARRCGGIHHARRGVRQASDLRQGAG